MEEYKYVKSMSVRYFCEVGVVVSCWGDIKQNPFAVSFLAECIRLPFIRWGFK